MSLELINTLGTVTMVVIVAATAIAALVQLRHLRAGNQINAMLSIGESFQDQGFQNAMELVNTKLAAALEDPAFRRQVVAIIRGDPSVPGVDNNYVDVRRAAVLVGNLYEELGLLVKNRIVDPTLFLDNYHATTIRAWRRFEQYLAFFREVSGGDSRIWENFEYIAVLSQAWMREHPSTYPKGVPRMQLQNRWPVPAVPATA